MAELVKYIYGTEAQILALNPTDVNWVEMGFYYPSDKSYFYQAIGGVMKIYGYTDISISGIGITLNDKIIGGVKNKIELLDVLHIPENYEYNLLSLHVDGVINCEGTINIIS